MVNIRFSLIYYFIKWKESGEGSWYGPYASGEETIIPHSYEKRATYILSAKAKDVCGAESGWGTLKIYVPRNIIFTNRFFNYLLERFPNAFPLLGYIVGLQ